jgi:hypothetical protein
MHKPNEKKYLLASWEGPYLFVGYKDGHGHGHREHDWHAPKFLVRPKMGMSYSNSGIVRNSGHVPNSQH